MLAPKRVATAAVLWFALGSAAPRAAVAQKIRNIHLEAESGRLTDVVVAASVPGYSGAGYVTGFTAADAHVTLPFAARAGAYRLTIRYATPFGPKGFAVSVNGHTINGMFAATGPHFATVDAGEVLLKNGANTIEVDRGWGYFDVDALDLAPAPAPTRLLPPTDRLADAHASAAARRLMRYLVSQYGRRTLSGQYDTTDIAAIHRTTGETPAIFGDDLMDYSPSRLAHGSKPQGTVTGDIAAARAGQIITLSWHWNAPSGLLDRMGKDAAGQPIDERWYKGFNTNATTFNLAEALSHPESRDYRLLVRDIDAIAAHLRKLAAAGVPVLWRPLHEAEGGWFWWGAHGPEAFKQLWRLMFRRFTTVDHLHNLIWVYTAGSNMAWYPGDAYVDVVGIDAYPQDAWDPLSGEWTAEVKQFGGRKLLALSEFGGAPNLATMWQLGVRWSYFVSWSGTTRDLAPAALRATYLNPRILNAATLPAHIAASLTGARTP
ncbi:MAG: beta-mannanase [Armatimonadetes bacterium]|nr:beta-mannanase [Armatimonadota bacterium]MDE2205798.1 beta-mannanase [Armatimonadota bacterium]